MNLRELENVDEEDKQRLMAALWTEEEVGDDAQPQPCQAHETNRKCRCFGHSHRVQTYLGSGKPGHLKVLYFTSGG